MQAWKFYQQDELHALVDASLQGDSVPNEACKFMKVGLLCTQSKPKLRPSMSAVVKMLTGETDIEELVISQPGLLGNMDTVSSSTEDKDVRLDTGTSSNMDNSSYMSTTSCATMTFNSVFDRD